MDESLLFEEFWRAYPQRPGNPKSPAREEWNKLAKAGALLLQPRMVGAARAYAYHCSKEGAPTVAHARTWLHQQRFNDWAPPEAPPQVTTGGPVPSGSHGSLPEEEPWLTIRREIGEVRWKVWFYNQHLEEGDLVCCSPFERDQIDSRFGERLDELIPKLVIRVKRTVRRRFNL